MHKSIEESNPIVKQLPVGCVTFSTFGMPVATEYEDLIDKIKAEDSRKAQARRNARKERARELTRLREIEIQKAKGSVK